MRFFKGVLGDFFSLFPTRMCNKQRYSFDGPNSLQSPQPKSHYKTSLMALLSLLSVVDSKDHE